MALGGPVLPDWTRAIAADRVPDGKAVAVEVGGEEVLVARVGEGILAVQNSCTHQGAPLDRGVVKTEGSMPSVTCAAHGSMFRLGDGRVLRGPATAPLATYEAREADGWIELRSAGAG